MTHQPAKKKATHGDDSPSANHHFPLYCSSFKSKASGVIKHGSGKSSINGGLDRKITYQWSVFHCHV